MNCCDRRLLLPLEYDGLTGDDIILVSTKVALGMFLLFDLASRIIMPKHQTNPNVTYTEQVMNRSHEIK